MFRDQMGVELEAKTGDASCSASDAFAKEWQERSRHQSNAIFRMSSPQMLAQQEFATRSKVIREAPTP